MTSLLHASYNRAHSVALADEKLVSLRLQQQYQQQQQQQYQQQQQQQYEPQSYAGGVESEHSPLLHMHADEMEMMLGGRSARHSALWTAAPPPQRAFTPF
eukprot:245010-Rhodomonas_salina.1